MNLNKTETSLLHFHILHLIFGAIVAVILLAVPKFLGVLFAVFILAMIIPTTVLPAEFTGSKWIDRLAVLTGAAAVWGLFAWLHKL